MSFDEKMGDGHKENHEYSSLTWAGFVSVAGPLRMLCRPPSSCLMGQSAACCVAAANAVQTMPVLTRNTFLAKVIPQPG